MQGLLEGNIIARRIPQFVKRIMSPEHHVRLIQTIRAQVEGCLIMDMKGESPIKAAFLSTKCIQESIATAAATRSKGSKELWAMIAQVKTISYNANNHSIYFHFYTRDMAEQFVGVKVPFHRYDHTVYNIHKRKEDGNGSIWNNQADCNGEKYNQAANYACVLRNMSRNTDLTQLYAMLKKVLDVPFQLEDMDNGGPMSENSTSMGLTVSTTNCPEKIINISRLYWNHVMIIIEHPTMRGRRQCLRCGELGHPMKQCTITVEEMKKSRCIVIATEDTEKVEAFVETFSSMDDLRNQIDTHRKAIVDGINSKHEEAKNEEENESENPISSASSDTDISTRGSPTTEFLQPRNIVELG